MADSMWVKFNEFGVCRNFNSLETKLFDTIPHGSGIDGTWEIHKMKDYFKCDCAFHVMNEHGYYVDWADFSVIIPFKNPEEFKLHFHGSRSQYLNRQYMLRDYLEDTMMYWIGEWTEIGLKKLDEQGIIPPPMFHNLFKKEETNGTDTY